MIQFKHTAKRPSARMFDFMWKQFKEHGTSHSGAAATLTHIMERAEVAGVPYTLRAVPGMGYFIKMDEDIS